MNESVHGIPQLAVTTETALGVATPVTGAGGGVTTGAGAAVVDVPLLQPTSTPAAMAVNKTMRKMFFILMSPDNNRSDADT
jgi:hypothetical protein